MKTIDEKLRDNGFKIYSRPKNSQPVWSKGNTKLLQADAIKQCQPAPAKTAAKKEQ
jgi:uncharacterized protein (DUF302 family)